MTQDCSPIVDVCCCHSGSRKDTRLWKDLEKQLFPLIHSGEIILWDSGNAQAGQVTRHETERHIVSADIILLLMSSDFISSSWEQMTLALAQFHQRRTYTLPILLYSCTWELTPLQSLTPLPHNRRPISTWPNRDTALLEVAQHIYSVVIELQTLSQYLVNQKNFSIPSSFEITPPQIDTKENLNSFPLFPSALKKSREGDKSIQEPKIPKC